MLLSYITDSSTVFTCHASQYFRWRYTDRVIRLRAVCYHSEQDLAFGQYQTELFYHAVFSSSAWRYMIQQKPYGANSYTAAQHSGFKMSATNLFANALHFSGRDYKDRIAQKQHRGSWVSLSCGLRAAGGSLGSKGEAKGGFKSFLHPTVFLSRFLPDHTLDLFPLLQMFCHFQAASASCTSGLRWVTGCSEGWSVLCTPAN